MKKPRVCVLRSAGTNCDKETSFSFQKAGAVAELVHINQFSSRQKYLDDYQILAIPGGFSYGDDFGAGKILANELRYKLADDLKKFLKEGKLIIGICNGFQILVKSGLLPDSATLKQETSLIINDSGKFEDRWVYLRKLQSRCVWTNGLPEVIYLPVAHGEGKFITKDNSVLERLKRNGQIVFRYYYSKSRFANYPYNPNGSTWDIAGICDETGRILGLMPHPERYSQFQQHPRWSGIINRKEIRFVSKEGDGLQIFRNGVEYAKKKL